MQFKLKYFVILLGIVAVYLHATTERERVHDRHTKEEFAQMFAAPITEQISAAASESKLNTESTVPNTQNIPFNPLNQVSVKAPVISKVSNTPSTTFNIPKPKPVVNNHALQVATKPSLHIICSSDCSTYQRWQVLTQIHSAKAVNQEGRYTWLVSGCGEKQEQATTESLNEHFPNIENRPNLHFTPDFADMSIYGGPYADGKTRRSFVNKKKQLVYSPYGNQYKFNNKPNSILHWSQSRTEEEAKMNEVVVLIDPDFMFMAPLEIPDEGVGVGKPAAQSYGLGDQWLSFNLSAICGINSPCTRVTSADVYKYYSAGPPYIIHAHDIGPFAHEWARLVPRTYDQYPMLYAEMFAYSMAAAQLDLKHLLLDHLMTGCMVGWPKADSAMLSRSVDAFKVQHVRDMKQEHATAQAIEQGLAAYSSKGHGGASSCFLHPLKPPAFLHYCTHYKSAVDDHTFGKRAVPHSILDCASASLLSRKENSKPKPLKSVSSNGGKGKDAIWGALAYCAVVRGIDHARDQHCSAPK